MHDKDFKQITETIRWFQYSEKLINVFQSLNNLSCPVMSGMSIVYLQYVEYVRHFLGIVDLKKSMEHMQERAS